MDYQVELNRLREQNLFREMKILDSPNAVVVHQEGRALVNFASNNYCAMTTRPEVMEAFRCGITRWGTGSGASRLVSGTMKVHRNLEEALAVFSEKEDALLFPTGYMANLGLITTLAGKEDLVCLDKIDHASIIDGARLSGARVRVFPHRNYDYLESILEKAPRSQRKLLVTDSLFSMDGDQADLAALVRLKDRHGALLLVDEAHAVGVFGPDGSGLIRAGNFQNQVDFKIGTLSKAFGLQGGYVAGGGDAITYLRNRSRPFIYTTALLPAVCEAALTVLSLFENMEPQRESLRRRAEGFRHSLQSLELSPLQSVSQIVPALMGNPLLAMQMEQHLLSQGFLAPAIRAPTVKRGSERIRFSLTMEHTEEHLERLVAALQSFRS